MPTDSPAIHSHIARTERAFSPLQAQLMMFVIGLMSGLEFLQNSMFSLASAYIRGGVDASPEEFVWTTAVYAITTVIVIFNQQTLVEWLGYRKYLVLSLLGNALGCCICASSRSLEGLIVGRIVQALGLGGLFTSSRILLQISFKGADLGMAMYYFIYLIISCITLAPFLSGYILENATWNWIFWAPMPLILVGAAIAYYAVPSLADRGERAREARENLLEKRSGYDYWPIALFCVAMVAGQTVLMRVQFEFISQSPALLLLLVIAVACLLLFFAHQWWGEQPLLHMRSLQTSPAFRWGLLLFASFYFLSYSFSYLFPLYAQQGLGFSVEWTGRLLFFSNLVSFAVTYLVLRYGEWLPAPKWLICAAFLCMSGAAWWFSLLSPGAAVESLYGPLALYGACAGLLIAPLSITTFKEINEEVFGHAFRLRNIVRQMCNTCGVAVVTSLMQHQSLVHRAHMGEHLSPYAATTTQRLQAISSVLTQRGFSSYDAQNGALQILKRTIEKQVTVASHLDIFVLLTGAALVVSVLVVYQKRLN